MSSSGLAPPALAHDRARRAWIGLVLCLAAPVAWLATLDVPFLRSTGAAAWALLFVALTLSGSAAWIDKRLRTRVLLGIQCAYVALFAWTAFGFARMPAAPHARELIRVADFRLLDQRGQPVALADELHHGPVLLVFFRGHW